MAKRDLTLTSKILIGLLATGEAAEYFIGTPYSILNAWEGRSSGFKLLLYRLYKSGLIKFIDKHNERFIKLTKSGELEALFLRARSFEKPRKWDGKWQIVVFDIPERSKEKRNQLRRLLFKNDFIKLQISVYISPHPLHPNVIKYLIKSKLIEYIRVATAAHLDDDRSLRKRFHLD